LLWANGCAERFIADVAIAVELINSLRVPACVPYEKLPNNFRSFSHALLRE
jgi:hypothetical protein